MPTRGTLSLFPLLCHLLLLSSHLSFARRLPTIEELDRRILTGAKTGNLVLVRTSVKQGGSPEAVTNDLGKSYPLHLASNYGHLDVVRYLVGRGAALEVKDTSGHTPLMYAAFEGHDDIVEFLLSAGASVEAACMSGETALHEAAQGGKTRVVELLLKHGHEIDPVDTRWLGATPLMWAARWGHTEATRVLLEAGADHKMETSDGVSLRKWLHYEETDNNPLYNVSGVVARVDIHKMLEDL